MRKRKEFYIDNFVLGMRRDAGASEDGYLSLRTIKNYSLVYTGDKTHLKVRKGYSRWNAEVLAGTPTQLYHFYDLTQQESILAICNDQWYNVKESTTHQLIRDRTATARRPILAFGNRFMFGVDASGSLPSWYWSDSDEVQGSPYSHQVGIDRPSAPVTVEGAQADGHMPARGDRVQAKDLSTIYELNPTNRRKIAMKFTTSYATLIGTVNINLSRFFKDLAGSIRVSIYTDDAGEPSTTLADTNSVSSWLATEMVPLGGIYNWVEFAFPVKFSLEYNTTYWLVLEGDDAYYGNYNTTTVAAPRPPGTLWYFVAVDYEDDPATYKYGKMQDYDQATSAWSEIDREGVFYIGGPEQGMFYDYVYTYHNSTYGIESRPSPHTRFQSDPSQPISLITGYTAPGDVQVDKIRLYRRMLVAEDEADTPEEQTQGDYHFVGEISSTITSFIDALAEAHLGAILQTQDHYALHHIDDTGSNLRNGVVVPAVSAVWKGRVWVAPVNTNTLYMSKVLEEDGASGMTGDMVPDYFPLDNKYEIPFPSSIIAIVPLSADQLAVYFKNSSIWVLWGANENLNPPSDISSREIITDTGLIAPGGVTSIRSRHVYLSRKGLYVFNGSPNIEFLSEHNQSIFDIVSDAYIDDSVVVAYGDEVWALLDTDNDGLPETLMVFDIQKSIKAWRQYEYDGPINDFVVRQSGTEYKTLLAASGDSSYILELETGTTDNGQAISTLVEPHDVQVPGRVAITDIGITGYWPSAPVNMDVTIRNHVGDEYTYTISPSSSDDMRGSHRGCRIVSSVRLGYKLEHDAVSEDELFGIYLKYKVLA